MVFNILFYFSEPIIDEFREQCSSTPLPSGADRSSKNVDILNKAVCDASLFDDKDYDDSLIEYENDTTQYEYEY